MVVQKGGVEPIDLVALKAQPVHHPEFLVVGPSMELIDVPLMLSAAPVAWESNSGLKL